MTDALQMSVGIQDNMSKPFDTILSSISSVLDTLNVMNNSSVNMDTSQVQIVNKMLSDTQSNLNMLQDEMGKGIRENTASQEQFNDTLRKAEGPTNGLLSTIKKIGAAYLSINAGKKLLEMSSTMSDSLSRVKLMNDGRQTTKELEDAIKRASLATYSDYQSTLDLTSSIQINGGNLFNNREALAFAEQINKHLTLSGASESGKDSVLSQIPKVLGAGKLQGQSFDAVLGNSPTIAKALMEYLDVDMQKLREMGTQGKITSQVLKNALFSVANETNEKFEDMPVTMRDVMSNVTTLFVTGLQPIFKTITELSSNEDFQNFMYALSSAAATTANIVFRTFIGLGKVIGFFGRNLDIIIPVLTIFAGAIIASTYATIADTVAKGIASVQTTALTLATKAQTTAQWALNAAMTANPIGLIIGAIIILIGLFFGAVAAINKFTDANISAFGILVGSISVLGAVIWNGIKYIINTFIVMSDNVYNHLAFIAETMVNLFLNPISTVKRMFYDLGSFIVNQLSNVVRVFDKIFKTDYSSQLTEFSKNLQKIADDKFGEKKFTIARKQTELLEFTSLSDAWDKGHDFGAGFSEKIGGLVTDAFKFDLGDNGVTDLLTSIDNNTAETNGKLNMTTEEIKYLRDVATQDTINKYTTASNSNSFTITNQISNSMDVNEVIKQVYNGLSEASQRVAEGI